MTVVFLDLGTSNESKNGIFVGENTYTHTHIYVYLCVCFQNVWLNCCVSVGLEKVSEVFLGKISPWFSLMTELPWVQLNKSMIS